MVKLITAIVALVALVATALAQSQHATLYEYEYCGGSSSFNLPPNRPDLTPYGWNNRARSARVTGNWLFYDLTNYNGNLNAGMEGAWGNPYCVNFGGLAGLVSSVRYAGDPNDRRTPSLTVYTGTYFQGTDEYTTWDLPNLRLGGRIASFIVTGSSTDAWTLYSGPNYSGNAVCIYPPAGTNFEPAVIFDTLLVDFPHNTIFAAKRGCFGVKIVRATSVQHGFHSIVPENTA